jgi:glyoxylase-like metal-dependent hydrolase (beta-lactamase superfamily II)
MREVTTQPMRVGQCWHPQIMTIRDGVLRPVAYPAVAMLMLHPEEGPILFDTGYDPAFLEATKPFPERFYRWLTPVDLAPGQDAASQCRARGVDPGHVRHLVLSHFHADHMSGTHAFPNARIHCARAGYDAACKGGRMASVRKGVLRALFPADFGARASFFEDKPRVSLPAELSPFCDGVDLIGDGALIAVELPGHCPGHWGLLVNDATFGRHFMIADAAWSLDAVRRNVPPPMLSTSFLGDTKKTRETLGKLHELARRNPDLRITPYHCPERAAEAVR